MSEMKMGKFVVLTTDVKISLKFWNERLILQGFIVIHSDAVFPVFRPISPLSTSVWFQLDGILSFHIFCVLFLFCYHQDYVSWQNRARCCHTIRKEQARNGYLV